jgi:hypothetical protein
LATRLEPFAGGFSVSFTLELVPNGQSGPPLETSLVQ